MAKTVEIFRNPDTQAQLAQAQQQQALAQALMKAGQSPDDMFSQWNRMPVVPEYGIGHGLTQLGSALAGAYMNKQATNKQAEVMSAEKAARQKAMMDAWGRIMKPGGVIDESGAMGMPGGSDANVGPVHAGIPQQKSYEQKLGDAMMALEAGVPEKVIESYLKSLEPYTLASDNKRFVGGQEIADNPAPDRPLDDLAKLKADLGAGRISIEDYMARRNLLTTRGAGVTINTGDNKYESEFAKQIAQADAAQISEYRKAAEAGRNMVKTIDELSKRSPGALSGGGANARAEIANWLEGWTGISVVDPEVLKDSQVFNATTSKMILDSLGGSLGAGVSNADVQFIKNTVPQLEYSKEAREELMAYLRGRASQNIDTYNRAREYGETHGGLKGFEAFPVEKTEAAPTNPNLKRNPDGSYTFAPK